MSDKLATVEAKVNTLAKPVADSLLAARTAIRVRPDLQEVFKTAKAENWPPDKLADALYVRLPEYVLDAENLWETCLYLADEFFQFGKEGKTLIVSRETGRALFTVSEKDIYVPEPVRRETGKMAVKPLPRLRPDLEGMIVQYEFSRGRDQRVLETLAKRVTQTEFLAQEGDNRLLRATRGGRKRIVDLLREDLPNLLPPPSGIAREFLDLLHFCELSEVPVECVEGSGIKACGCDSTEEHQEGKCDAYRFEARASVITPVVDPLASNLRHDPYTLLKRQIASKWATEIATHLANTQNDLWDHLRDDIVEASVLDSLPSGFWIADPNVAMAFREAASDKKVLPVPGVRTILLHDWSAPVAYLCVDPDSYKCDSREFLERWEVAAVFSYTLYVKPGTFSVYQLKDVPESGLSVEVVS